MSDAITITSSGVIGMGLGGLAMLAAIAGTWAVLRHRVEDMSRTLARAEKRLTRLEHWQQREAGARSAIPHARDFPNTAPIEVVSPYPRHPAEDSEP